MRASIYARQSLGNPTSIADQIEEATTDAAEQGFDVRSVVQDGTSASRLRRKDRANWPQLRADVVSGAVDVIVLWETSRGSRDLTDWSGFLDLCRKHHVLIRVVTHRRTYDMTVSRDWKTLAEEGVSNAYASEETRDRVNRAVASAARRGRPPVGPCPYGYERFWDPRTGKLLGQRPHPEHSAVVVEIFGRVAEAEPIRAICRDLDARGVPTPNGAETWRPFAVRKMCLNTSYISRRGEFPGDWPSLVGEATFHAARRVLQEPARLASNTYARPGRQEHLLSYLAACDRCGGTARTSRGKYLCEAKQCFSINQADADAFIIKLTLRRLSSPDLYERLRESGETASETVRAAEDEIAALTTRLGEWRRSAAKGQTTPATMAVIEEEIGGQLAAAERRRDDAALPSALNGWTGPLADVTARWDRATVQARRAVIRALIVVKFVSAEGKRGVAVETRLGASQWVGDNRTWAEIWAEENAA